MKRVDLRKVRFFVDENFAGVGHGLMHLRDDVVVATHPEVDDVPRLDSDWIPVVAARGWVIITNDKRIRTRPHEAPVAVKHRLRCAHIASRLANPTRWDFVRVIAQRWTAVERLCEQEGPVWLSLTERRAEELPYAEQP